MNIMTPSKILILAGAALLLLMGCTGADERMARHYERGMELYEQGDYEKARLEFKNALQIDPRFVDARYQLARTFEALQNWRQAAAHYRAATEHDPEHVEARAALAKLYLLGNAPDQAREVVDEALALDPAHPGALVVQGGLLLREGNLEAAAEAAQQALAARPDDPQAMSLLASVRLQQGDPEAALEALRAGMRANPESTALRTAAAAVHAREGDPAAAAALLEEIASLEPEVASHRVRLAGFHANAGDLDAAQAVLEQAVADLPAEEAPKLALVELLARHRGADAAVAQLQTYIDAAPEEASLRFALAKLHEARGDQDAMVATYEDIVAREGIGPRGLEARTELARHALRSRDLERARTLVAEVLAENPRAPDALAVRGDLALLDGDLVNAIADYRAVLRSRPDDPKVLRALAQAHLRNGEPDLAQDMLRTAVEANPDNAELRIELAELLARQGRPARAAQELEAILARDESHDRALEGLVKIHLAEQDYESARAYAERYRAAYPERPQGYYFEGLLAQAEGDAEGSLAAFEASLAKGPDAIQPLTAVVRGHLAAGRGDAALERLDEVLAERPENFVAHNLRGETLLLARRYEAAEAAFRRALELQPALVAAHRNLALAQLARDDAEGAVASFRDGIQQTDSNALRLGLANVLEGLGRHDEAIAVHDEILARAPDSKAAANNLAMLLVSYRADDPGSLARAGELVTALEGSEEPAYLDTLGWVRLKQGDVEAALPALRAAVEKSPDSPELRYHLGMAELDAGDRAAALEHLRLALADDGARFRGRTEAEATLRSLEEGES